MGFIPQILCRHCGNKYLGIYNRCPHCGTRRVKQSGRAAATTTAASKGSAANARLNINAQWQFIFGCVLVVAVIAAVIILITASLGGGQRIDIEGNVTWQLDAGDTQPETITVNLTAGGKTVESLAVSADKNGEWKYSFDKLDKYDEDDNEIKYAVSANAISGKEISAAGYNLLITTEQPEPVVPDEPDEPEVPVNTNIHSVIINFLGSDVGDEFSMTPDEDIDLDAVAYPVDEVCTVMWKSTNEDICTVDADGVVTPVGNGWGSVVAYVGDVQDEVKVRVWGFED